MQDRLYQLLGVLGFSEIKAAGKNYMVRCPFHGDKKPSLGIMREKHFWNCFGCGEHGTLPQFVARLRGIDEVTAELYLIDYGITKGELVQDVKEDPWADIRLPDGSIPESVMDPYRHVGLYMLKRGFELPLLKLRKVGHDDKSDDIVIPVQDYAGRFIGLVRRKCDGSFPPYKNIGFKRDNVLYNYHNITTADVVITEGILDCLWCIQHGFTNTIAGLSQNLSWNQMNQLLRFDHVTILFDNDMRGYNGAKRLIRFLTGKTRCRWALLPMGKDPCDCNKDQIWHALENSINPIKRHYSSNIFSNCQE